MKHLSINLWMNREWPVRHGYTAADEDEIARFRIGPLVVGWEVVEG